MDNRFNGFEKSIEFGQPRTAQTVENGSHISENTTNPKLKLGENEILALS
jgi:hypothetical protein